MEFGKLNKVAFDYGNITNLKSVVFDIFKKEYEVEEYIVGNIEPGVPFVEVMLFLVKKHRDPVPNETLELFLYYFPEGKETYINHELLKNILFNYELEGK